MLYKMLK